jgi:spore germination protein GerM
MLMFAGAAVIVLILAAVPILLFGGGGDGSPVATTTTVTVPSTGESEPTVTSTSESVTTTSGEEPSTTVPGTEERGVIVFLVQTPENSFTGDPAVVPFFTSAPATAGEANELVALRTLFTPGLTPPPGFENYVPGNVEVLSVTDGEDQVRVVDMSPEFVAGSGTGALGDFTMLNQMIFTVTDEELFPRVLFTVNGEPVTEFGSEGLDISQPLGRDSFQDQMNSVIVDSAIAGTGDAPLVVTGIANVFEANVSLQLVDLDGNVVHEAFTTATCGSGCWGDFSFNIDGFDFEADPVTLKVFWNSPEDGEPSDVVSIPVSWGDDAVWDLLP